MSTLPRLRLEEARRQALRHQGAQHDPVQVLHPRGHHQEHRLHGRGRSVRVDSSRQRYPDPNQMSMTMEMIICVIFNVIFSQFCKFISNEGG